MTGPVAVTMPAREGPDESLTTSVRPHAGGGAGPDVSSELPSEWPTGRLMSAITRRVEREWNAHLAHWDLNHASLPVLAHLAGGPRSQRELASACEVTEQTMSKTLARLERTGYIERPTRAADRRRHDVVLTSPGFAALRAAGEAQAAEEMVLRGLEQDQIDQLRGLLLQMWAAAGAHDADEGATG